MRSRFKPWAKSYLEEHEEFVRFSADDLPKANALEIGSGKGDFAVSYAKANPDKRIIAIERDTSISGLFAKKVVEAELKNLILVPVDLDLVYEGLAKNRFEVIYLNFSDPWPKKKHAKRRLTFAPRLKRIADLLEEDGMIALKTDNDNLFEFTKEQAAEIGLTIAKEEWDYPGEEGDFMTEYERHFRSEGQPIHRLILKKQ